MLRHLLTYLLSIGLAWTSFAQTKKNITVSSAQTSIHSHFFILQKEKVYGLGDSGRFFKEMPTGDTIFHLGNKHFAVRNNKSYSIYNESGKALLTRLLSLKEFGDFVIAKDSAGSKVVSKTEELISENYDSVKFYTPYAILYKKNKQGIVKENGKFKDLIAPLYDKVGPYYEGVLLINHGQLGWKSSFEIPVQYDHIYKEQAHIMAAQNKQGTVYYNLYTHQSLVADPADSVVFYDHYYKTVRNKKESVYRLSDNKLIGESELYQLHPYSFEFTPNLRDDYLIAVKDSVCALFHEGKPASNFSFENFLSDGNLNTDNFRIVQNGNVGVINNKGEFLLHANYTDVLNQNGDYFIVRRGHKIGLAKTGDSLAIPIDYRTLFFSPINGYAFVSRDGKLLGLYDYLKSAQVVPCEYDDIEIFSPFILARKGLRYDVYCKSELRFTSLSDIQTNTNTVKGYKNGSIYLGYFKNDTWEEYSYTIPSYKINADSNQVFHPFHNTQYTEQTFLYDYASGKWGEYNYTAHTWASQPLAHSGDNSGAQRLLAFAKDTIINWNGIHFRSQKSLSPIYVAWKPLSRYHWIDGKDYSYASDATDNTHYNVSPVCYKSPGKGHFSHWYPNKLINAVFTSEYRKSIFIEDASVEIGDAGEIGLSDFITQLSCDGNAHPNALSDYEKLIDPSKYIGFKNGTEHVLQTTNSNEKHFSIHNSFEHLDKKNTTNLIARFGTKYGVLLSPSVYLLKPEYEYIQALDQRSSPLYVVGVKGSLYKVYDPATKTFSKRIAGLLDAKDELLLLRVQNTSMTVLNLNLDTLIKSPYEIKLLGGSDYSLADSNSISVYRNQTLLFVLQADAIEKINEEHFLARNSKNYSVVDVQGKEIFTSTSYIKHLDLGTNYLLNDGKTRSLFDNHDQLIYSFKGSSYLATAAQDLIIKEDASVLIFKKNQKDKIRINGKFSKVTDTYLVVREDKLKSLYRYDGSMLLQKASAVKILDDEFVSYKEKKKYYLLNTLTGKKKKVKKLNVDLEEEAEEESDLLNDTSLITSSKSADKFTITKLNGLYGLRTKQKTELENSYFVIQKLTERFLVQDELDYKLFNSAYKQFLETGPCQAIYPYKQFIMVVRGGKISYTKP